MLSPQQTATALWPIAPDVPDLTSIVQEQAEAIAAQAVLIDRYQGVLNNAQTPLPGSAICTATGTTLAVGTVSNGPLVLGAVISGTGVPAGTTLVSQQSGAPGEAGNYTTSVATTAAANALTFTPGGGPMPWPSTTLDAADLTAVQQSQSAILRQQSALIQGYQDLLNVSATPAP